LAANRITLGKIAHVRRARFFASRIADIFFPSFDEKELRT
jgi:hypothetical protein